MSASFTAGRLLLIIQPVVGPLPTSQQLSPWSGRYTTSQQPSPLSGRCTTSQQPVVITKHQHVIAFNIPPTLNSGAAAVVNKLFKKKTGGNTPTDGSLNSNDVFIWPVLFCWTPYASTSTWLSKSPLQSQLAEMTAIFITHTTVRVDGVLQFRCPTDFFKSNVENTAFKSGLGTVTWRCK